MAEHKIELIAKDGVRTIGVPIGLMNRRDEQGVIHGYIGTSMGKGEIGGKRVAFSLQQWPGVGANVVITVGEEEFAINLTALARAVIKERELWPK